MGQRDSGGDEEECTHSLHKPYLVASQYDTINLDQLNMKNNYNKQEKNY